MTKQEVDPVIFQDFNNLMKKANSDYKLFKNDPQNINIQQTSSIINNSKYKSIFDIFLKNSGLYSKIQFLLNKATHSDEMESWNMSFFTLDGYKNCKFTSGKKEINFAIPTLADQISLICSEDTEYFGILFAFYLNKQQNMILETAVCVNMLLTILENEKREAA